MFVWVWKSALPSQTRPPPFPYFRPQAAGSCTSSCRPTAAQNNEHQYQLSFNIRLKMQHRYCQRQLLHGQSVQTSRTAVSSVAQLVCSNSNQRSSRELQLNSFSRNHALTVLTWAVLCVHRPDDKVLMRSRKKNNYNNRADEQAGSQLCTGRYASCMRVGSVVREYTTCSVTCIITVVTCITFAEPHVAYCSLWCLQRFQKHAHA
jgi:hypothetical protein